MTLCSKCDKNNNLSEKEEKIAMAVAKRAIKNKVLPKWELKDIHQELQLELWLKRDKYRKDGRAKETTFWWNILWNKVLQLREKDQADRRIINIKAISLSTEVEHKDGNVTTIEDTIACKKGCSAEDILLKIASKEAVKKLLPRQQVICRYLGKEYSIKEIVEILDIHRKSIAYQIAKIREIFIKEGLR